MSHKYVSKNWKHRTVELEGCQYLIKYSPETEQIIVHQPAKTIVGYRKTIGNHYPEILAYDGVGLEQHIAQMLIMERPKGVSYTDGTGDDVRMPKCMTAVKHVDLSGNTFILSYNWGLDLLVIHIPEIVTQTLTSTIAFGTNELKVLHNQRLLAEINEFVWEMQEDDLSFNPEDFF
jgi:hypothetical protein